MSNVNEAQTNNDKKQQLHRPANTRAIPKSSQNRQPLPFQGYE